MLSNLCSGGLRGSYCFALAYISEFSQLVHDRFAMNVFSVITQSFSLHNLLDYVEAVLFFFNQRGKYEFVSAKHPLGEKMLLSFSKHHIYDVPDVFIPALGIVSG